MNQGRRTGRQNYFSIKSVCYYNEFTGVTTIRICIPVHVYTYNVRLHFKYIRKTISTSIIYICENMKPDNLSLFELYSYKGFIATMFTIYHKSLYYQKFNKKQLQILWPKVNKTTCPLNLLLFIYHTPPWHLII